jgi:hypothetical protein
MSSAGDWVGRVFDGMNRRDWGTVEAALSDECSYKANGSPAKGLACGPTFIAE